MEPKTEHAGLRWTYSNRRIRHAYKGYLANQGKLSISFLNRCQYYIYMHQFRAVMRYWAAVQSNYRQADFWHFV